MSDYQTETLLEFTMKKIFLMLSLGFLLLQPGCQEKSVQEQISDEVAANADRDAELIVNTMMLDGIYTDDNLTFVYPTGSQKKTMQTAIGPVFMIYLQGGEGINFSCLTQALPQDGEPVTLEEYTEVQLNDFASAVSNPTIITKSETEIGGYPGYERTYRGTRTDGSGIVFEFWNSWTVVDDKAFMFSLTGPADGMKDFRKKAEKIVNSVKFN